MTILLRMVRTRSFDPSTALARAVELFSAKGYSDTSMDDIVKATGVSRYGLYGTFGNKRELFEQALEKYADDMGRQSFMRLLDPDASLADIRAIFDQRVCAVCDSNRERGCLLTQTAIEVAPHDAEIRGVLMRFLKRMSKTFTIGLETARSRGEVREDLDLKQAGEYLLFNLFALLTLARAGFPRETLDAYVEMTLATVRR